jgi:hypothetical protein
MVSQSTKLSAEILTSLIGEGYRAKDTEDITKLINGLTQVMESLKKLVVEQHALVVAEQLIKDSIKE